MGAYDWSSLYNASHTNPDVNLADYVSSAFIVGNVCGRGRRVTAQRDVAAGELPLMVKPVASVYETPPGLDLLTLNLAAGNIHWPSRTHLTQRLSMR